MVKFDRATVKLNTRTESELAEFLGSFYADPYGFVMAAYPWGEPTLADGSYNPLANKIGPEEWQKELLDKIGEHIRENIQLKDIGLDIEVWRSAIASGHGVGKSTIVAWLIHFFMSTRRDTRGVVTANTQRQLEDKTWPELAKWHALIINKHWFTWTATSYYFTLYPEEQRKNYMMTAMTVSEQNSEAFAGLHNEGKTVLILFDEASGIFPKLWEVADGALTDGEGIFCAFGNPTRPDGEFADCFDKHADMYYTRNIDSRSVSHTNKSALNDIIRKYGEDSDEVRVRIKGQFPRQSYNGFISFDAVSDAIARELHPDYGAALIMAVDVARFGRDDTVIGFRQGRDARSRPFVEFKGLSVTRVAEKVMFFADKERPDAIVIESTGPGAGVIDICRDRGYRVVEVHPGSNSSAPEHYYRKRDELWGLLRDWMYEIGCIADDPRLTKELTSILYTLDRFEQRIKLEPKEEYKERTGMGSPDKADTLALTFGVSLARRDSNLANAKRRQDRMQAQMEYDPMAYGD